MKRVAWSSERDDVMRDLIASDDTLSAEDVASRLTVQWGCEVTRNSVIGRAGRQGIPLNGRSISVSPKPATTRKPRTTPDQRPDIAIRKIAAGPKLQAKPFTPRVVDVRTENVTLLELAPDGCRWPSVSNGDQHLFCNHQWLGDGPYCSGHARIAFQASRPSTRPSYQLRGRA